MNYLSKDLGYSRIVNHILENEDFLKISNCKHHGITRLEHSLRVSYFSYKICKKLHLNAKETAEAGLLHDFFTNEGMTKRQNKLSIFIHPKKSLKNASYYFDLTDVIPDYFFLATKRTDTRINDNSIKQVFVPNELFDFGKTHLQKTISMIVSNVKIACNFCRGLSCPLRHTPMRSTSWGIFFVIKNK